ncbi:hypothetical protein [Bradyrhizobium nitroreducens]|uniref:hypothetical protein n=1 Tax=Bradyrhizobium nitroreducens TaxID=709803 RepID=UPI00157F86DF|nr:hypothetical protein [Bradyrhizobium nitroreducens]
MSSLQLNVVGQHMGVGSVPASAGVETTQRAAYDSRQMMLRREVYCRITGVIALPPSLGRE